MTLKNTHRHPGLAGPAGFPCLSAPSSPLRPRRLRRQQLRRRRPRRHRQPLHPGRRPPYDATGTIAFNSHIDTKGNSIPDAHVKDINVELPPGFVGNPTAVKRCTQAEYGSAASTPKLLAVRPPARSASSTSSIAGYPPFSQTTPVYNMVPPPGVAAEFAFSAATTDARAVATVGPGPDYRVSLRVSYISSAGALLHSKLTLWGVPADPAMTPAALPRPQ